MTKDISPFAQDSFSATCSSITNGIISFFLLILVTVFPLIVHNSYFDILETKYMCFYLTVLIMLGFLLIAGLIMLFIDQKEFQGIHTKALFGKLKPCNWKSTFSIADFAVFIFWLASVISTLQSEYFYESFWPLQRAFPDDTVRCTLFYGQSFLACKSLDVPLLPGSKHDRMSDWHF